MNKSQFRKLYFLIGSFCWILLGFLASPIFNSFKFQGIIYFNSVLESSLLISISISGLLFYKITISEYENFTFNELLWKISATGFLIVSIVTLLNFGVESGTINQYFQSWLLPIEQLIITSSIIFYVGCFYVFKRLIFFQKTLQTQTIFKVFEYGLFGIIFLSFLDINSTDYLFQLIVILFFIVSFILSLQLKWIAYLTFKQKITSVIYTTIIFLLNAVLFANLYNYAHESRSVIDLTNELFLVILSIFIGIYSLMSFLVLFFNLPTSSVFDKKFSEVLQFQKLSEIFLNDTDENSIIKLISENATATLVSTKSFIINFNSNTISNSYNISKEDCRTVLDFIFKTELGNIDKQFFISDIQKSNYFDIIEPLGQKSLLYFPISINNKIENALILTSELRNGFEKELISIVETYISQATLSISHNRLLKSAVDQATYLKEIEIAKKVKKSLLPKTLPRIEGLELAFHSSSSDDVGGDFFDFHVSDNELSIVVGDVSGKGTAAAFNMAEFKGVYQSLVDLKLDFRTFVGKINKALSSSFEKNTFTTAIFVRYNIKNQSFRMIRAGHCPAIFYNAKDKSIHKINQKGLGLAILRNEGFQNHIEEIIFNAKKDDIILLYTDGLIDINVKEKIYLESDQLSQFIIQNKSYDCESIKNNLIQFLTAFNKNQELNDDLSFIVIKVR